MDNIWQCYHASLMKSAVCWMMMKKSLVKPFLSSKVLAIHLHLLVRWWAQILNMVGRDFIRRLMTSMEKLSMPKETTCLLSKNQVHQSLLHFPILLTTSTTLFLSLPSKKSGSIKFLKEFQKSGMKWPFWNKKFNRVLQLIWLSNKKESPNWTFQKSSVLKIHLTVEACLWITSKHAGTKM